MSALLQRLRDETRSIHERLERDLGLTERPLDLAGYRRLLSRFYGFHRSWEPAVAAALGDEAFTAPRRRLCLLERDLVHLGLGRDEIELLPACPDLPPLRTVPDAMGSLYVMEGSTLGGRVIAPHLERTLGLDANRGCAYFISYGDAVPQMWREFRARLAAASGPGSDDAVVTSATRTFERLHAWLVRGG